MPSPTTIPTTLTPREKLVAGRLLVREKAPYFRAAVLSLIPREAAGLGTVGITERGVLMVDYAVIAQWTIPQIAGALVHEIGHLLRDHPGRCGDRDRFVFNLAGDMAMNDDIVKMGFELPEGALHPAGFGYPENLAAEDYYARILKDVEKHRQNCPACGQEHGQGQPQEGEGQEGKDGEGQQGQGGQGGQGKQGQQQKGQGQGGQGGGQKGSGKGPRGSGGDLAHEGQEPGCAKGWCGSGAGRPIPGEPDGEADAEGGRSRAEMARVRKQTAELMKQEGEKSRGTIPAGWAVWAEEVLGPPKIRWQDKLARVTRNAVAWRPGGVDHRYDAPSRRQGGLGYGPGRPILPRLRSPVPRVSVVVDTSGSMGKDDLTKATREVRGVLAATGSDVDFCACDAAVHELRPIRDYREVAKLLKGGGGTDFAPAFEALMTKKHPPEVIVFITDGCGPAPAVEPRAKVIWVLVGKYQQTPSFRGAPWGEVISVED